MHRVQSPGFDQIFKLALVTGIARHAFGQIHKRGERPVLVTLYGQLVHRVCANIPHRPKRVTQCQFVILALLYGKGRAGLIQIWWQNLYLFIAAILSENGQLVCVAIIKGHRRGHELNREVGFQPGGLITDKSISSGM